MSDRYALRCATAAAIVILTSSVVVFAQGRPAQPETVMIVLHAKPGAETELGSVLARHWSLVRKLNLVQDAPHLTLRATEESYKVYFVETFTWRDANIPDNAPLAVQSIWAEMNKLVEPRGGKPAIEIIPVAIVAARAPRILWVRNYPNLPTI